MNPGVPLLGFIEFFCHSMVQGPDSDPAIDHYLFLGNSPPTPR